MTIYLGTDHAGFALKEKIKLFLLNQGHQVTDCGAFEYNPDDDYPDFVSEAARKVAADPQSKGIVLGKSGTGECIVANKISGIRSFLAINEQNVRLAREHNDANIMAIGSEIVSEESIEYLIKLFVETPFSNEERHLRRINKISELEKHV